MRALRLVLFRFRLRALNCNFVSVFFFFKQKTAYEMRISDWSSDVCSSDLPRVKPEGDERRGRNTAAPPPKPVFAGLDTAIQGDRSVACPGPSGQARG